MKKTSILIGASVLAVALGTALYAQEKSDAPQADPVKEETILAEPSKIEHCLGEAFNLITLPSSEIREEEDNRTFRVYEEGNITAKVRSFRDHYRADDPERKSDQVHFFAIFEDRSEDSAISIYRSTELSFNENGVIPDNSMHQLNHALYAHRDPLETERSFTPTEKEATIEKWVNESIFAMSNEFETCMGFREAEDDVSLPTFPEL